MSTINGSTGSELVRELVRAVLDSRGWRGKDLAAMIGVSPSAVSRAIGTTHATRNRATLARISKQLGFDEGFLGRVLRGERDDVATASVLLGQYRAPRSKPVPRKAGSLPRPGPTPEQRTISEQQRLERARRTASQRLADMERRIAALEGEVAQLRTAHPAA